MAKWYSTHHKSNEIVFCKTCSRKFSITDAKKRDKCPACGRGKDGFLSKMEQESRDRLLGK
jgi:PHP family Zn ribbon phosphoesterase